MRRTLVVSGIVCATLLCAASAAEPQKPWTLKEALKRIDKALDDVHGMTADVSWDERIESRTSHGQGKIWVRFDGRFRGEVEGGIPRTILLTPGVLYEYRPLDKKVEVSSTVTNPSRLLQYAIVGFYPAGSQLKRDYEVSLVREEDLDDQHTVLLSLVPKSERVRSVVPNLLLWVDTTRWVVAQQRLRYQEGSLEITARYAAVTPRNDLPDDRFVASWPEGTAVVGK